MTSLEFLLKTLVIIFGWCYTTAKSDPPLAEGLMRSGTRTLLIGGPNAIASTERGRGPE